MTSSITSSITTPCSPAAAASDCEGHLDRWIVEQMLLDWGTPDGPSQTAQLLVRLSDESVKDPSLVLHLGRMLRQDRG